jgi:CubicO group peptidase (beta-lactamase class C family)
LRASDQLAAELRKLAAAAQSERRVPSISAAVFRAGEVVWSDAIGLADAEAGRDATPETQYRIGSITKTFTAAAVMQLRDAGELDLDDRLGDHVPESAHAAPTLRRLLSHLSGLQREPPGDIWESLEAPERDAFLASLADAEQVLKPGERWHYSNLAFSLLGEVVARRSGTTWQEYVESRLLAPLGLARTSLLPQEPVAQGYYVQPYSETVAREAHVDMRGVGASGQLWSTTGDLARWASCLAGAHPDVLAAGTSEEMHVPQAMMDLDRWTVGWGIGLELVREGERVWAGHGGAMPGHLAGLVFRRQEQVGAAVLTNTGAQFEPSTLAVRLAEKALELEPVSGEVWRPEEAPPAEVEAVLGRWWSEGHEFVFRWRGGRLEAKAEAAPAWKEPAVFAPDGADSYRTVSGRERGERLRVVRDEAGEVVRLYWATYPMTRSPEVFGGS